MRALMLRRIVPLLCVVALSACIDFTGLDIAGGHLTGIDVTKGTVVEVGDTVRLTAAGDIDGLVGWFSYDPVLDARWTVSNPSIARLEPLPPPPKEDSFPKARTLVRGVSVGTVRVIATPRGVSGEATVRVFPVVGSIALRAERDTLSVGDTLLVTATAFDGAGVPIDDLPVEFESDGGLLFYRRDNFTARFLATAPGQSTVTARFRRVTAATVLTVVPRAP
jgi:hypothetical protein